MRTQLFLTVLVIFGLIVPMTAVQAAVVLIEPGHTLNQLVDSVVPLDPSQTQLDTACAFGNTGNIESIGIDAATGTLYVQLNGFIDTCVFDIQSASPHPVGLVNPSTQFVINSRGTDLHFDPATGLLVTMDMGLNRIATVSPIGGATGTYSLVTPGLWGAFSTFGMDFSTGTGGSDVPAGDIVFTSDTSGNGIHSATFGGAAEVTHVTPPTAGDDMVIQPDGDWVHVPDFNGVITAYAPTPPHAAAPSPTGLNLVQMFSDAGLPFQCGSRATVCDTTGELYVSYSCDPGGSGIFRVDEALTTATLMVQIGPEDGLHDLVLGPATSGSGNAVYFTVHNQLTQGEEVWEVTVPECEECDPDPRTQGYWHRQCLGVPASEGGLDPGRNGRGPQQPTEPGFVAHLMPTVGDQLAELVGETGGACAGGMDASPPKDPCEKALKQYTALLFNIASDRLQNFCQVDLVAEGCSATSLGGLVDELAQLLNAGDAASCKVAAACAAAVNEGDLEP